MSLLDLTYPARPADPAPAIPHDMALLFGLAKPPKVGKPTRSHRIEPDAPVSPHRKTGPKTHAEMMAAMRARRADIVKMLKETGEATTGAIAEWSSIRSDVALNDMRALEKDGLVKCRMTVRSGHQTNIWSAT